MHPTKSIPDFFAEQSIFLTGATGFLGKVFVEKLLRSCPDIREIFLLMRSKKGKSIEDRLEEMLRLELFDTVRNERPSIFKKIVLVSGDANKKELGISPADRQMLIDRVSIVVHCSANVKFNNSLTTAILTNVRATRDICILAENMKNLVALVYISTMYTHTASPVAKEITYPPKADWRKAIEIAELVDCDTLNTLSLKYMDNTPNTYVFTKNIAEDVIKSYSKSIPCAIVRPTMVICTESDPFPGWLDNHNGPAEIGLVVALGLVNVIYTNNAKMDQIPVDYVIKSMIQATWKRGLKKFTPDSEPLVFNASSLEKQRMDMDEQMMHVFKVLETDSLNKRFWTPSYMSTTNFTLYYILSILCHAIPALIVDQILKFSGRKPIFLKLYRSAYISLNVLSYYVNNTWTFDNTNVIELDKSLLPEDKEAFKINWEYDNYQFMYNTCMGVKKFILKEDVSEEGLEAARIRGKKLDFYIMLFRIFTALVMLWIVYRWNPYGIFSF